MISKHQALNTICGDAGCLRSVFNLHVARAVRVLEDLTKVTHAVITILLRFAHVRVPDTIDSECWLFEIVRHASGLVLLQEQAVGSNTLNDLCCGERGATEQLMVCAQCFFNPVKVETEWFGGGSLGLQALLSAVLH